MQRQLDCLTAAGRDVGVGNDPSGRPSRLVFSTKMGVNMKSFCAFITILLISSRGWAGADALDEVNAARASRGLRPFVRDDSLTVAAIGAADFRAAYRISGHTSSDFSFLPPGVGADAAGCAAWSIGWGWGSCCTYENWQYAGAAYSIGSDGRRYMHLFVRGGSGSSQMTPTSYVRRLLFRRR